ncbi:hypothetical protein Ddye_022802 [Dipteronia dyeriana]|uniref:Glycosyl transferase CAP10 domain-containing protein n=1 Tax=Dipteronia dyeriana TaxID=168575 RepID=A0AAD9WRI6_9ROSI|nr:hypothetical protein Ddye_022802 [Dipteronia dyeriana]
MESLSMDRIYDYMFHLISEYSKLLDFKPSPPSSALEVCSDSLLCLADPKSKQFLERSTTSASPTPPCKLQNTDGNLIRNWMQQKKKAINDVETMKAQKQPAG